MLVSKKETRGFSNMFLSTDDDSLKRTIYNGIGSIY